LHFGQTSGVIASTRGTHSWLHLAQRQPLRISVGRSSFGGFFPTLGTWGSSLRTRSERDWSVLDFATGVDDGRLLPLGLVVAVGHASVVDIEHLGVAFRQSSTLIERLDREEDPWSTPFFNCYVEIAALCHGAMNRTSGVVCFK
jgi:hypothetical protein